LGSEGNQHQLLVRIRFGTSDGELISQVAVAFKTQSDKGASGLVVSDLDR
jgi:hypothetical protein